MKIRVFDFAFICLLSCNDGSGTKNNDNALLQERLNRVEARMDSFTTVLKEKELQKKTTSKKEKRIQKKSSSTENYLSSSSRDNASEQTWKSVNNQTGPSYRPVKEKEAYQVRIGAICCDGSRSYATGRGACSHHGGVCEWLYQ